MDNPFSWDYLTTIPGSNEVFGPFAVVFLVVFAVGLVVSIVIYSGGAKGLFPNPVMRRMAQHWSAFALGVFGVGLFFFIIRWLQINPLGFGMRLWLWLSWLALLGLALYVAYDLTRNYPKAMRTYEEQRRRQQYLRPAAAGPGGDARQPGPGAPLVSGARPVKRRKR